MEPLEEIAVLVPDLDPLAGLVAGRLGRLPWHDGVFPVCVVGGLPLVALAVVRALRAHLAADVRSGFRERVYQQRLDSGREGAAEPAVWILPFDFGDGEKANVDAYRQLEGRVLARYLRWLVESSGVEIVDPLDGRPRRIR